MSLRTIAAARQKEIKLSMAVVTTSTFAPGWDIPDEVVRLASDVT
jgi:hypothetical protein